MLQQPPCLRIATLLAAVLVVSLSTGLRAADQVKVHLHSGRILTGEMDPRTDDDALWLRFHYSSLVLSSSYVWSRVESVQLGADRMSADEFRLFVQDRGVAVAERASDVPREPALIVLPRRHATPNTAAGVASLWATARLANWDRDAEFDGLEVCIVPRNLEHELVSVGGHLRITLVAPKGQVRRTSTARRELSRWSVKVQAKDFREGSAVYRLPFRRSGSGGKSKINSRELVELRLHVFGQGSFAAETPVQPPYLHSERAHRSPAVPSA